MSILLLNTEDGWRGGERQTLLSMQGFCAAGHHVSLVARQDGALAQAAQNDGFDVVTVSNVLQLVRALWRARRQYHVFHAQTASTMTWLALLRPWLGGIVVFTRRTAFALRRRARLTAWKWRQADVLVAISQAAAKQPQDLGLTVHYIIPSAVAYQPEDAAAVQALRQRFALEGRAVVATIAALSREKDPLSTIRAFAALRAQRSDVVFLHFGQSGALSAAAQAEVATLGLEDDYIFAGFYPNISDAYRVMDAFILSSRQEGLGSSVLDAFLYRVPVVCTSAGGLAELAAEGRAIACPPGDDRAMAAALACVLHQPEVRQAQVDAAQSYVVRTHGLEAMADAYLQAYQGGLTRRRSPY